MILLEVTGSLPFDYFFSLIINIGLPIFGFAAVASVFKSW